MSFTGDLFGGKRRRPDETIMRIRKEWNDRYQKRLDNIKSNPRPHLVMHPQGSCLIGRHVWATYTLMDARAQNPNWRQNPSRLMCHRCGKITQEAASYFPSMEVGFGAFANPPILEEYARLEHPAMHGDSGPLYLVRMSFQTIVGRPKKDPAPTLWQLQAELARREALHTGHRLRLDAQQKCRSRCKWQLVYDYQAQKFYDVCTSCGKIYGATKHPRFSLKQPSRDVDQLDVIELSAYPGRMYVRADRAPLQLDRPRPQEPQVAHNVQVSADRRRVSFDL